MKDLLTFLNIFWRKQYWSTFDVYDDYLINEIKTKFIGRWKEFLQRMIDNWYIEEIKSEKKSWPDLNDYIKYIAETEDPIKTLSDMIKTEEKK